MIDNHRLEHDHGPEQRQPLRDDQKAEELDCRSRSPSSRGWLLKQPESQYERATTGSKHALRDLEEGPGAGRDDLGRALSRARALGPEDRQAGVEGGLPVLGQAEVAPPRGRSGDRAGRRQAAGEAGDA
jgi:hypothetical protein